MADLESFEHPTVRTRRSGTRHLGRTAEYSRIGSMQFEQWTGLLIGKYGTFKTSEQLVDGSGDVG